MKEKYKKLYAFKMMVISNYYNKYILVIIILNFYDKQILYKIPGGKSDFDNKSKMFILGSYEISKIRL